MNSIKESSDFMMSDDLEGVFDPLSLLEENVENQYLYILDKKFKFHIKSISYFSGCAKYALELVDKIDLSSFLDKEISEIRIGEKNIDRQDVIKIKISAKNLKLTLKHHNYK